MRAVVIRSHGDPEVLVSEEVARPVPLLTEVLVRGHVSTMFRLEEAARAHALLAAPGRAGKIVLTL